jgi:hypothetical protein
VQLLPAPIDAKHIPNVFHTGYHAEMSFAATPYFLQRKKGNVLVDVPRYSARLATRLAALGGVHTMIITHGDSAVDHQLWKQRFPDLQRVIHQYVPTVTTTLLLFDVDVVVSNKG